MEKEHDNDCGTSTPPVDNSISDYDDELYNEEKVINPSTGDAWHLKLTRIHGYICKQLNKLLIFSTITTLCDSVPCAVSIKQVPGTILLNNTNQTASSQNPVPGTLNSKNTASLKNQNPVPGTTSATALSDTNLMAYLLTRWWLVLVLFLAVLLGIFGFVMLLRESRLIKDNVIKTPSQGKLKTSIRLKSVNFALTLKLEQIIKRLLRKNKKA